MHQGRQAASGDLRLDELDLTWIEHKPGKRESIEILWCVLESGERLDANARPVSIAMMSDV